MTKPQTDTAMSARAGSVASPISLSARMRGVLDEIAARAAECEEMRQVPSENVAALRGIGYLRALVPPAFGGGGMEDLIDLYRAGRLLATACPSTAWAMQLLMGHAHVVAALDPQVQREVWASGPDTLVCTSVAPFGRFTRVAGGIRISGSYQFASGCDHAEWAILGGVMENPLTGEAEHHLAILPRADYRIEDSWFAMGMKGSGSNDIVIDDAFVPDYRVEPFAALAMGTSRGAGLHPGIVYRIPFMAIFGAGFSVIALGITDGMISAYGERLRGRVRAYTGAKVLESLPASMRLAESTQELYAATLMLETDWADFIAHGTGEKTLTQDTQVAWRTNQAFAIKLCVRASDRLFDASGGSGGLQKSRLQRYWRDLHMAAGHAYTDYDVAAQILGRHLMNLPPDRALL